MLTTELHPAFQTPIDNEIDGIKVNPNQLLRDLLQSANSLLEIAADHKLNLQQLIVWCDQPAIRSLLDQADSLATRIAAHKAAQSRPGAVQLLAEQAASLCESAKDRETAGKSARSLLRMPIAEPPSAHPTSELVFPRSSRRRLRMPTPDRAKLPTPGAPDALDAFRVPVYRFRLGMPRPTVGPLTITPYEIIESDTPANMGRAAVLRSIAGEPTSMRRNDQSRGDAGGDPTTPPECS